MRTDRTVVVAEPRYLSEHEVAAFQRNGYVYITYNKLAAGDPRVRYYADKRKSFPPDIERNPNRTYTFRV